MKFATMRQLGRDRHPGFAHRAWVARSSPAGQKHVFPALLQGQVDAIVKAALAAGISWFDTAEGYGPVGRNAITHVALA